MSKKRHTAAAYDPVLKPRYCATCGQLLVGFVELGLTWWLDATPLTPAVEQVYRLGGRRTYHVRVQRAGGAWVVSRLLGAPWPTTGVVLVEHLRGHTPGTQRARAPDWLQPPPTPRPTDDIDF